MVHLDSVCFRWPGAEADCITLNDFYLAPRDTVFLRGPSGGGKSTLLSLVAGVLTATSGKVELLGHDWKTMPASRRDRLRADHVGYVFQQFNLLSYLSVLDNVLLPCRFSRLRAARACSNGLTLQAAATSLLVQVGLDAKYWHRSAAELSVGQQQRVAAARALIGQPELVIADEPTSALDEALRDSFMTLLLRACHESGSALLFVSHDSRLSVFFDRVIDLAAINNATPVADIAQ